MPLTDTVPPPAPSSIRPTKSAEEPPAPPPPKSPKPHHMPNPYERAKRRDELGGSVHHPAPREDPTALSFTRSLMFYGHGSITEENARACVNLQEARDMRKKYFMRKVRVPKK